MENLGSVGPGTMYVAKANKKGVELTTSLVTNESWPVSNMESLIRVSIRKYETQS
jgi:hypothetical protein